MLPRLTGDTLWHLLRYEAGYTEYESELQGTLGPNFDEYRSAYGVGGYYYETLAVAFARLTDFDMLSLVERYATPKDWAHRLHFSPGALNRVPGDWPTFCRNTGAPVLDHVPA